VGQIHFVIPNRAESPVRNLLFVGQQQVPFGFAQGRLSRDKAALRNDSSFKLIGGQKGTNLAKQFIS